MTLGSNTESSHSFFKPVSTDVWHLKAANFSSGINGAKFVWCPRIEAASVVDNPKLLEDILKDTVIGRGLPLVITGWNDLSSSTAFEKEPVMEMTDDRPSSIPVFSFKFLLSKHGEENLQYGLRNNDTLEDVPNWSMKQYLEYIKLPPSEKHIPLLYGKDVRAPPEWQEAMRSLLPPSLCWLAPQNDIFESLPLELRAESVMIYIGYGGTRTPAHFDVCGTLGHNLLTCVDDPSEPNSSGAVWMCTSSADEDAARSHFISMGQSVDLDDYFMPLEELRLAKNVTWYIVDQRLGDLVLLPAGSVHQVLNVGGASAKMAWNTAKPSIIRRMISHSLVQHRLSKKMECYRVRLAAFLSLISYTRTGLNLLQNDSKDEILNSQIDVLLNALPPLIETVALLAQDEWLEPAAEQSLLKFSDKIPHKRVCNICAGDIFNIALHWRPAGMTDDDLGDSDNDDVCLATRANSNDSVKKDIKPVVKENSSLAVLHANGMSVEDHSDCDICIYCLVDGAGIPSGAGIPKRYLHLYHFMPRYTIIDSLSQGIFMLNELRMVAGEERNIVSEVPLYNNQVMNISKNITICDLSANLMFLSSSASLSWHCLLPNLSYVSLAHLLQDINSSLQEESGLAICNGVSSCHSGGGCGWRNDFLEDYRAWIKPSSEWTVHRTQRCHSCHGKAEVNAISKPLIVCHNSGCRKCYCLNCANVSNAAVTILDDGVFQCWYCRMNVACSSCDADIITWKASEVMLSDRDAIIAAQQRADETDNIVCVGCERRLETRLKKVDALWCLNCGASYHAACGEPQSSLTKKIRPARVGRASKSNGAESPTLSPAKVKFCCKFCNDSALVSYQEKRKHSIQEYRGNYDDGECLSKGVSNGVELQKSCHAIESHKINDFSLDSRAVKLVFVGKKLDDDEINNENVDSRLNPDVPTEQHNNEDDVIGEKTVNVESDVSIPNLNCRDEEMVVVGDPNPVCEEIVNVDSETRVVATEEFPSGTRKRKYVSIAEASRLVNEIRGSTPAGKNSHILFRKLVEAHRNVLIQRGIPLQPLEHYGEAWTTWSDFVNGRSGTPAATVIRKGDAHKRKHSESDGKPKARHDIASESLLYDKRKRTCVDKSSPSTSVIVKSDTVNKPVTVAKHNSSHKAKFKAQPAVNPLEPHPTQLIPNELRDIVRTEIFSLVHPFLRTFVTREEVHALFSRLLSQSAPSVGAAAATLPNPIPLAHTTTDNNTMVNTKNRPVLANQDGAQSEENTENTGKKRLSRGKPKKINEDT